MTPQSAVSKRASGTAKNRQALVEATLDSIAEVGIAGTSVSEIIQRAGLSRGMIHLHFGGKDNLLVAAVKQTSETYYHNLEDALARAGDAPEEKLLAVIDCDLGEANLNRRAVNIWYAFRGEARERTKIARYTDTRDKRLNTLLFRVFRELADREEFVDPSLVARDATHGTLAMMEGLWSDFLLHPESFDRKQARRVVLRFLSALFPASFNADGPIA